MTATNDELISHFDEASKKVEMLKEILGNQDLPPYAVNNLTRELERWDDWLIFLTKRMEENYLIN